MSSPRYRLKYKLDEVGGSWQELPLDSMVTIGRNPDCQLILSGTKISRTHAKIWVENEQVMLQDLNSSNGTYLDGVKVNAMNKIVIPAGGNITIGDVAISIVDTKPTSPSATPQRALLPDVPQSILWYRIEQGEWKQAVFQDMIEVGRGEECGLCLDEGHVSRKHLRVSSKSGVYSVVDLGSHNGTYMEGKRLQANVPQPIHPGQYFTVGRVSMTIANSMQQSQYRKTMDEIRAVTPVARVSSPKAPLSQQGATPFNNPPKRGSILPWLLGIGALLMLCICVSVFGALVLLNSRTTPPIIEEADNMEFETEVVSSEEEGDEEIQTNVVTEDTPIPVIVEDEQVQWLVMLYQVADDEILEYDIVFDANEAELIGSSDKVKIVTQLDRYAGGFDGDGNWAESRLFELIQDTNIDVINSPILANLGEIDSGNVQNLVDFAVWAIQSYPAEHYILIMSDHGGGWFGGYTDGDNGNTDGIYLPPLMSALDYITQQTGIGKLDILGFDACLMAQLEVWSVVAPYAEIGIASEETESATGWAYAAMLERLTDNPDMSPADFASIIVDTFVEDDLYYQLYDEDPSYIMASSTLSAIDLNQLTAIHSALNNLAYALQYVDQSAVAEARTYTMSYVLFSDYNPFFLDLVHFGQNACSYTADTGVCSASDALSQAVSNAMIVEKHGDYMSGSNGITFYFPESSFFEITVDDSYGFAYRQHAEIFAGQSMWDEFLDFHYLGRSMP